MRRALVTGGARRIGAALSRALAADGWHVIVHHNASSGQAAVLAAEIAAAGGRCDTMQADLSDRAATDALVPRCIERFGALDALVNNASSFRYDSFDSLDWASWDAHLATNLVAPVFLAQAFAQASHGRAGAIVTMLDQKVTAPNPDFFSYTVAKQALAGATQLMAQALRAKRETRGVRVNGIAPGITLLSGKQTEEGFDRAWHAPPLGRSSTPEELADALLYVLATPSLNGQILVLDGGDNLLARQRDIAFETHGE